MTNIMTPAGAGTAAPEKDEAPGRDESAQGFRGQGKTDSSDCAQAAAQRKRLATLTARLALQSFSLHELACGGYLIARWDRTAHCNDLDGVAAFLRRVDGEA